MLVFAINFSESREWNYWYKVDGKPAENVFFGYLATINNFFQIVVNNDCEECEYNIDEE